MGAVLGGEAPSPCPLPLKGGEGQAWRTVNREPAWLVKLACSGTEFGGHSAKAARNPVDVQIFVSKRNSARARQADSLRMGRGCETFPRRPRLVRTGTRAHRWPVLRTPRRGAGKTEAFGPQVASGAGKAFRARQGAQSAQASSRFTIPALVKAAASPRSWLPSRPHRTSRASARQCSYCSASNDSSIRAKSCRCDNAARA